MSKVNLPSPYKGENTEETVEILMDTVLKLRKELSFLMYNLDEENVPYINSLVEDISGNFTLISQTSDAITSVVSDVSGNTSSITQNSDAITSVVSDVSGNTSSITQNSDAITFKVDSSDYTASIIVSLINSGTVEISAHNIDLNGIVNVNKLLTIGTSTETEDKQLTFHAGGVAESFIKSTLNSGYSDLLIKSATITLMGWDGGVRFDSNVYFNGNIDWGTNSPTAVFG